MISCHVGATREFGYIWSMASILPTFEYDIFISYRLKDNKGEHWVTNFVTALKAELEATFKEDISIYFDQNPDDGLQATHDVDDSLKEKLRCLIFIPIVSQTYCDTKSFAWEREFLVFKKLATDDRFGLKIKLASGNVASRILPICIHELEPADRQLVEAELGGALRGIEFIYKTAGVLRPLKAEEPDAKANLNHTFYHDQINKVARACKDLVNGILATSSEPKAENRKGFIDPKRTNRKWLILALILLLGLFTSGFYYFSGIRNKFRAQADRSIAVLPFENMSKDPDQDYFSNGIAEDILNHLTKVSDLKVKSRTSTLQYKGTQKSITEIGEELNVGNVLEGSVRRVGDKVRIVVQLIDVKTDLHLWSETYDRELKDVLSLQSEIAIEIANALNAQLTASEKEKINREPTKDATAYDYYLQARERMNAAAFNKKELTDEMSLIDNAIKRDPTFSKAYALKASLWFLLGRFGLPQSTWQDSVFLNTSKSISLDPESSDAYVVRANVNRYLGNLVEARNNTLTAWRLNPKDLDVQTRYGYQLLRDGDERGADLVIRSIERNYSTRQNEYYESLASPLYVMEDYDGAIKMLKEALKMNRNSEAGSFLFTLYTAKGDYDGALRTAQEELRINPGFQGSYDNIAWAYYRKGDLKTAASYWSKYTEIESQFQDKTQRIPFRSRLAMTLQKMGEDGKAKALLMEDLEIQQTILTQQRGTGAWGGKGYVFYDLAVDNSLLGNSEQAIQFLDSALHYDFNLGNRFFKGDPAFEKIKDEPSFKKVQKQVDDRNEFRKRAFANAFNRAKASRDLKNIIK
jgi:TolB-like protein/Flp pilus assembly protein TadD